MFVGYLLLDAIVANRDRHEQNWAVLEPNLGAERDRLSPSFDHASSLGFQLTDDKRSTTLAAASGLARFAERGTAWRFEHRGRHAPTLVALAVQGLRLCSAEAADYWRSRLHDIDLQPLIEPMTGGEIATMSPVTATFVTELLQLNARRLEHAIFDAG